MTPLHTAVVNNRDDIVKLFSARMTDLDVLSFSGYTAFQLAAMNGNIEYLRVSILMLLSSVVKM